jgi:hypothetical protein
MTASEREKRIDQYAAGPARLRAALAGVPPEAMQWRPARGEWSAHEIAIHCADSESNGYCRIRYLLTEADPVVVGYDQDGWARDLDYHTLPVGLALTTVEAVRAATVPLLRRVPEAAWQRRGRHTELGPYGPLDWLRIYADHLEVHARQIEANMTAWRIRSAASAAS